MPECAKTHSNLEFQNFPGEDPRTPCSRGGEGRGREGGRGRMGKGGEGREGTGKRGRGEMGGGEGTGGALPRDNLWIRPLCCCNVSSTFL